MDEESQPIPKLDESSPVEEARVEKGARRPEERPVRVISMPDLADKQVTPLFPASTRIVRKRVIEGLGELQGEVDAARAKAALLIEEARVEAAKLEEDARREGRAEGYGEWLEELEALRRERERTIREAEGDLLILATRLASRIVGRSIEADPAVAAEVVAESLQHVRGDEQIVVHVSPADLACVESVQEQLVRVVGGSMLYFEADDGLDRGDCVIVTSTQRIDARLDTQLGQMRKMLEAAP